MDLDENPSLELEEEWRMEEGVVGDGWNNTNLSIPIDPELCGNLTPEYERVGSISYTV